MIQTIPIYSIIENNRKCFDKIEKNTLFDINNEDFFLTCEKGSNSLIVIKLTKTNIEMILKGINPIKEEIIITDLGRAINLHI